MSRRALRSPLLHFLLLGMAGFAVYDGLGGNRDAGAEIVVDEREVARLKAGWSSQWNREPTPEELAGLVDAFVREETLYREALALGLDRDDTIVRRRLAQKMEFLAQDSGGPFVPTDADLAELLSRHPERFEVPARYSFRQVFLDPDARGERIDADARELLAALRAGADPQSVGDRLLLGERHTGVSQARIGQLFGAGFGAAVAGAETGQWLGPLASGYGLHLVYVDARSDARIPALDEVRERVLDEWVAAERDARLAAFHAALRERHPVRLEAASLREEDTPRAP